LNDDRKVDFELVEVVAAVKSVDDVGTGESAVVEVVEVGFCKWFCK